MIQIFEKRGRWCYRDEAGRLHKFDTEIEAKSSLGLETMNYAEEEIETEDSEEETYTDEQEIVFDGESDGEEEV
jgi:hypothetical protein